MGRGASFSLKAKMLSNNNHLPSCPQRTSDSSEIDATISLSARSTPSTGSSYMNAKGLQNRIVLKNYHLITFKNIGLDLMN